MQNAWGLRHIRRVSLKDIDGGETIVEWHTYDCQELTACLPQSELHLSIRANPEDCFFESLESRPWAMMREGCLSLED